VTYFTDEDAPFLKPCVTLAPVLTCWCADSGGLDRIANVLLQSGSAVPEWITSLPKPSKLKRRLMGKAKRGDAVNPARRIGRADAMKRR
jgi:ATP-dependent RNA helicase DDX52/ROK1